jgi:aminoglycoside phosphotransferase family enzyme/predicted kinase
MDTIPEAQREAARMLEREAGGEPHQTHISAVFVGPHTAWKMKKAVKLSFLDFSSLEARRHFLERERDLNRRTAPEIYGEVLGLVRVAERGLAFAPLGEERGVEEWVLVMRAIPAEDFLDAIASRGAFTALLAERVADAVAEFHETLPPLPRPSQSEALAAVIAGNIEAAAAAGLDPRGYGALAAAAEAELERRAARLDERARAGLVRRAHGDLHLSNICRFEGEVRLIDALEFDEALATIDLGYDLAFLLMDLEVRTGRALANRALNRYLTRRLDFGLCAGLSLFLGLRAMVLTHVEAKRGHAAMAASYAAYAKQILAPLPQPRLIAIGGLSGSGKSTLARALAPLFPGGLGAVVLSSDALRKARAGLLPEERLGAEAYTPEAGRALYAFLREKAAEVLAAGHSVIIDATFHDAAEREAVAASAAACGVPFSGLWLTASRDRLEQRLRGRGRDASEATLDVLARQWERGPHEAPLGWKEISARTTLAALAEASAHLGLPASPALG